MPVQVAGAERVPGVQLGGDPQVNEPVRLQRFPEIARRVRWHAGAHLRDALELGPARRIALSRGQLTRLLRVPLREPDHRVRGDAHGLELFAPGVGIPVACVVELRKASIDGGLEVTQPAAIDLVIQHRMAGRALLHELGEDAGVVCRQPLVRHLREEPLAHRLALPERDDRFFIDLPGLRADLERNLLARIQDVQVGQGVTAELRKSGRGLGRGALFAHDQLAVADGDRPVLHQVAEGQGPAHGRGEQPIVQAIRLGHQDRALRGDGRDRVQAFLAQAGNTWCDHVCSQSSTSDGVMGKRSSPITSQYAPAVPGQSAPAERF